MAHSSGQRAAGRAGLRVRKKGMFKASSQTSLLAAMKGCIDGCESLHTRAGMLQCDILPNNLMINMRSTSSLNGFSDGTPGVRIAEECYHTSYTLIDSHRRDLRCLCSEVVSLRSGSHYVVRDITGHRASLRVDLIVPVNPPLRPYQRWTHRKRPPNTAAAI
jgi:hypothetical protein